MLNDVADVEQVARRGLVEAPRHVPDQLGGGGEGAHRPLPTNPNPLTAALLPMTKRTSDAIPQMTVARNHQSLGSRSPTGSGLPALIRRLVNSKLMVFVRKIVP